VETANFFQVDSLPVASTEHCPAAFSAEIDIQVL
jgi:hypothetical protein